MKSFKLFGAALMLSAAMATPVFAQAAISEPGAYAFYHPNGDVLHAGSPSPASDALAMIPFGGGKMVRHHMSHHVSAKRADRYGAQ
jgi:hypothetical protein